MPERKSISLRKEITSPLIIKELDAIKQDGDRGYNEICYDIIHDFIHERIRQRELSGCVAMEVTNMNTLRFEVNRILDKYSSK